VNAHELTIWLAIAFGLSELAVSLRKRRLVDCGPYRLIRHPSYAGAPSASPSPSPRPSPKQPQPQSAANCQRPLRTGNCAAVAWFQGGFMHRTSFPSIGLLAAITATTLLLAGCGLAETAVSGTAGAAAEAQQAQQARQIEQHVRDQVQAAEAAAAAQRDKAEQDAQ